LRRLAGENAPYIRERDKDRTNCHGQDHRQEQEKQSVKKRKEFHI
jgi:hypothetical protein